MVTRSENWHRKTGTLSVGFPNLVNVEGKIGDGMRGILNSGYLRSGKTSLCIGQGAQMTRRP